MRCILAVLAASLAMANATLLFDLNPAVPGAAVTDIGDLNYEDCPVQFPNCKTSVNPGTAKVFYVNQSRYVFDKPASFDRAEVSCSVLSSSIWFLSSSLSNSYDSRSTA